MSPADYSAQSLDALIAWFLRDEDPLQAGAWQLARAISQKCADIAEKELRRQLDLGQRCERELLEETVTDVLERVWDLLCKAQHQGNENAVREDAEALVRGITGRALADRFRRLRPERYRLLCTIGYILGQGAARFGFTTHRQWAGGAVRYGLADVTDASTEERPWNREAFVREKLRFMEPGEMGMPELIRRVLEWHGRAMTRREITFCLTELMGRSDSYAGHLYDNQMVPESSRTGHADHDELESTADIAQALRWLWSEIAQLPDGQCRSILLRMDSSGIEALAIEVGYSAIAERLGVTEEELLDIVDTVPLAFDQIGDQLGMSAQQAKGRRWRGWDRIERRYRRWQRESGTELGLLSRWISLLDRSHSDSQDAWETG